MRLALVAAALAACQITEPFMCASDAQCRTGAGVGVCEATGYCSVADPSCVSSSRRYDASAGGGLAGTCAPVHDDPLDVDHDGIGMGDNCPTVANPDQHDEDQDGKGDLCDPCPISFNTTDTDGDGLPDDCDPYKTTIGDNLVLFEGFAHGVPTGWATTGTWTQVGDSLMATAGATMTLPVDGTTSETVTIALIEAAPSSSTSLEIIDPSVAQKDVECGLSDHVFLATKGMMQSATGFTVGAGTPYILALFRKDGMYTCAALGPPTTTTATLGDPTMVGPIVIQMDSPTAKLEWVQVVRSPH